MTDILLEALRDCRSYPLWVIFSVQRLRDTGRFVEALAILKDDRNERFAPIFTDKDLARRIIEEHSLLDYELMPLEDYDRVKDVLFRYFANGVEFVGVDFSTRAMGQGDRRGEITPIRRFFPEA